MSNQYTKTVIIGSLVEDPILEQHEIENNRSLDVAKFSIANDSQVVSIQSFGNQAKLCASYLHKGNLCCIEGVMRKDAESKRQLIIAERITFLSSKPKQEEVA